MDEIKFTYCSVDGQGLVDVNCNEVIISTP